MEQEIINNLVETGKVDKPVKMLVHMVHETKRELLGFYNIEMNPDGTIRVKNANMFDRLRGAKEFTKWNQSTNKKVHPEAREFYFTANRKKVSFRIDRMFKPSVYKLEIL